MAMKRTGHEGHPDDRRAGVADADGQEEHGHGGGQGVGRGHRRHGHDRGVEEVQRVRPEGRPGLLDGTGAPKGPGTSGGLPVLSTVSVLIWSPLADRQSGSRCPYLG